MNNTSVPLTRDEVFSRVPKSSAVTYSTFARDHRHLTAFDASYMIPILVDEVLPGDIYEVNGRHLNRLLAAIKPFMDNLYARFIFTYCPTRIVWPNWEKLMGAKKRPDDPDYTSYSVPMLDSGANGIEVGSIFDYAGIPVGIPHLKFSAIPFRMMNLFYNEFIRDENLMDWRQVGGSGSTEQELRDSEFGDSDQLSNYSLFRICKKHDYFTSGLPFQQYGVAQSISIGNAAPVIGNGRTLGLTDGPANFGLVQYASGSVSGLSAYGGSNVGANVLTSGAVVDSGVRAPHRSLLGVSSDPSLSGLVADLTNATGFTISDLRTSIQLQALKELNARMGHRYKEIIYGEFDVTVSDATLDRPEFLGSYTIPFNIIPVASTAETSENVQGNLSAIGFTDNSMHHAFSKAFEEHGYVIGYVVVQTDQTYQQGLERQFTRDTKYDFYTPLLADISEQPIKMKEILAQGSNVKDSNGEVVDEKTFNFQEAWAEYRYKPNRTSGRMRSQSALSLDVWHLGTEYAPTVIEGNNIGVPFNADFLEDNTRELLTRVLAVQGEPQIESDNYFSMKCTREMPIYSVPAYLLGRL